MSTWKPFVPAPVSAGWTDHERTPEDRRLTQDRHELPQNPGHWPRRRGDRVTELLDEDGVDLARRERVAGQRDDAIEPLRPALEGDGAGVANIPGPVEVSAIAAGHTHEMT